VNRFAHNALMTTHPLWRPYELPDDDEVQAASTGRTAVRFGGRVEVVTPDPRWPALYADLAADIREALGSHVLGLEHVGSTSVPVWAKPVIDIDLTVAEPAAESSYVPPLEERGFVLSIREPEWEQHRGFTRAQPRCNLHVFGPGAIESRRHIMFRDWLRGNAEDRALYAQVKRSLSDRVFRSVMEYNGHKAALIYDIYERAFAAATDYPHTPQPRPTTGS